MRDKAVVERMTRFDPRSVIDIGWLAARKRKFVYINTDWSMLAASGMTAWDRWQRLGFGRMRLRM